MAKTTITRDDIHLVSRNSNATAPDIKTAFEHNGIYAGKAVWRRFLHFFLIGLGLAFVVAGILFFFAFNWANLHKFAKLGLIEGLLVACVAIVLLRKRLDEKIKNILLSAAAMLVGVLFAVFGQIYQTGADAYDLFLGWTAAILLWTIVSSFPVLWLIFMILCNTTLCLYAEQVANIDTPVLLTLLFLLNTCFVVLTVLAGHKRWTEAPTQWLSGLAVTIAVTCITIAVCTSILDHYRSSLAFSFPLAIAGFAAGIWYGFRSRNLLYLAEIPFAILLILVTLIIKPFHDPIGTFFLISILIIGCTTLLIIQLVKLNKRWHEDGTERS